MPQPSPGKSPYFDFPGPGKEVPIVTDRSVPSEPGKKHEGKEKKEQIQRLGMVKIHGNISLNISLRMKTWNAKNIKPNKITGL